MVTLFYDSLLLLSLLLLLGYLVIWHKHFDIHITLIFTLVPLVNLGYAMLGHAETAEAACMANRLTYLGGCYLQLILMLAVFTLCHINIRRWMRVGLFTLSTIVYVSSLTINYLPIFYKSVTFARIDGVPVLTKEYGPMHTVFYLMVFAYFAMSIGAIIYAYRHKNQVSRKTIYLLFFTEAFAMLCFFGGRAVFKQVELLPLSCDVGLIVYLVIAYRISLYDITDTAIDSLVQTGATGFVSIDLRHNYLGSNETAKAMIPRLASLTVDLPLSSEHAEEAEIISWLNDFEQDESHAEHRFERDGRSYLVTTTHLYTGRHKRGYQLFMFDDTENQRYIHLLNSFNDDLQKEVERKTAHIVEMHDNLILSMAMMVESRDNSTGGHIRRTSEGVRLLIEAMRASGEHHFTDEFCRNIVKAAPMHDLGKIAVDDAILRKPGRFTPEEFEEMKSHAAEGARIVHEILKSTDDEEFRRVAENVAHYHHERWDGSGYPEGLSGEEIPIEARIMAIADVYDALVSKRVYKESMSFEQADAIIRDGMGSQFDRALEPYYLSARPKLERYYRELGKTEAA